MKVEEIDVATTKEGLEVFKDAGFIIRPEVARRIRITNDPISNDLEYLGSLKLRVEGNLEDDGGRRGLRFKIESLNPDLNLSFRLKGAALERIITTNIDGQLKEILQEEEQNTLRVKAFLDEIGVGIKDGYIELSTKDPTLIKEISASCEASCEETFIEEARDEVILHCYQPAGAIRPAYGAWCLACCAICPLPTGLTYTHLRSYRMTKAR